MKADERPVFTTAVTAVERPQRRAMLDVAWIRRWLETRAPNAVLALSAADLAPLLDIAEAALACTLAPQLPERMQRLLEVSKAAFVGEPTIPEARPWRPPVDVARLRGIAETAAIDCTVLELYAAHEALHPLLDAYEGTLQTQPGRPR